MHSALLTLFATITAVLFALASPALSAASDEPSGDSSYDEAKALVDDGNFVAALPILLTLTIDDASNADAWNLLGYTNRKLGNLAEAAVAYQSALSLNPDHLGALEYQGELFLETGQPDLARANLTRLQGLCGTCEEAEDLAQAIAELGA